MSHFYSSFLITTLLSGLLASISGGIVGSYVVIKRISFISGAIAHAVLGGIGLSIWLSRVHHVTLCTPMCGALFAAVVSALLIAYVHTYHGEREDTVISAVWSFGMSLGILFLSMAPGFATELSNFLIGNILWTTSTDLFTLLVLDIFIVASVLILYHRLLLLMFDENQARLQGINIHVLYSFLLILIAVTTVLLMQIVGIILVMTVLTLPPACANFFTKRLSSMMVLSTILSTLLTTTGTLIAFTADLPIGATIAIITSVLYLLLSSLATRRSFVK